VSGEIDIDSKEMLVSDAIERIRIMLVEESATTVDVVGNTVLFKANFFRLVFGWNRLINMSRGWFRIEKSKDGVVVSYEVDGLRSILNSILCATLIHIIMFVHLGLSPNWTMFTLLVIGMFLLSYIYIFISLPEWVRKTLQ
jgi:hypothetical protein